MGHCEDSYLQPINRSVCSCIPRRYRCFILKVNMNTSFKLIALVAAIAALPACTRIETGEVGVRVGFDKQVKQGELLPGSFNQTFIGDVLTFPVKDVNVVLENMTPVAKDNSTMKDLDAVVVYNINPQQVAELYSTKNKSFHAEAKGDTYVMYNYIVQNARNAIYKAARKYEALDMADNRTDMENYIKEEIVRNLAEEKLDGAIMINQVMIRNVLPSDTVVESANALVRSKNELKQKEVEVKTAEAESRRMAALANNSGSSIAFMQAQAMLNISEGIKNGKVQTIVVPSNFNALMMNK
jgi:regulator of protease activity HflC (stomatin/prohibitin superfamily)